MYKTVITPHENTFVLSIPKSYVGKTLELLLYSSDEFFDNKVLNKSKKPSDFFNTLCDTEGEKFKQYVTNSRLEWDRNV